MCIFSSGRACGLVPISPRFDFLNEAVNEAVNFLNQISIIIKKQNFKQ